MKTGFKILLTLAGLVGLGALASKGKNTPVKQPSQPKPDAKPPVTTKAGDKKPGLGSILFVGDSNTFYPWSYADQFITQYGGKIRTKKIAKIGVKTDWMLTELKKELATKKWDCVCVLGGSNDIYGGSTVDKCTANLLAMVEMVNKQGGICILITPPSKDFFTKRNAEKNEMLNSLWNWYFSGWFWKLPDEKKPNYWIDFIEITSQKKYFSASDGYLHPQKEAHTILLKKLMERLTYWYK